MLQAITDKNEIEKATNILFKKLAKLSHEAIDVFYTTAGDRDPIKIFYSKSNEFWWANSKDIKSNRYWNPFGLGKKPKPQSNVVGPCQFNYNYEGFNPSTGGLLAKDSNGNLYLLHSGRLGGGKKGVGKNDFKNFYTGESEIVVYENKDYNYFVVTGFQDPRFHHNIIDFVLVANNYKSSIKNTLGSVSKGVLRPLDNGEYLGIKTYDLPAKTVIASNEHSRVTTLLIDKLRSIGLNVYRDQYRDAYTTNSRNHITRIFEVKVSLDRQKLYTAIGQLTLHSLTYNSEKFFVIESNTKPELVDDLGKLSIKCIMYEWGTDNESILFSGLETL